MAELGTLISEEMRRRLDTKMDEALLGMAAVPPPLTIERVAKAMDVPVEMITTPTSLQALPEEIVSVEMITANPGHRVEVTLPMSRSPKGGEAIFRAQLLEPELIEDRWWRHYHLLQEALKIWRAECREHHGRDLLPKGDEWELRVHPDGHRQNTLEFTRGDFMVYRFEAHYKETS